MGRLLQKVIAETAKLPEEEQEAFAAFMLAELESEKRWDELFSQSQDLLARMAEEARREYRAGLTEPLDPDTL
jgi:predicted amidophosphoribosyltransferase